MATSLLRCGTAAARSASTCPLKNVKVTALAINLTSPHRCQLHSLHTPANICASENRIFGKTSRYFSMATRLFQVSSDQAHAESDSEAEGTPEDGESADVVIRKSGTASSIPAIRFGERDKTRETPVDITVAFAEIRKQAKWNQTVEVVVKVSTYDKNKKKGKPRDQFRGLVLMPHAFKAAKRIAVLATGADAEAAKAAGAVIVGDQDLLPKLASGEVKFDVLLSTVPLLQPAKKFGRQLGRAMPSVKRGTAGEDVASLVREHLAGILYKMDASGRVACGFGKTSLGDEKLTDNLTAFLQSVETNRLSPQGKFILACRVSSAQTRTSFLLDLNQFQLTP